jgi:mRNA interferase RelE/StbE
MKVLYEKAFLKDIDKLKDQKVSDNLAQVLREIKEAKDLSLLRDIKKLKGHPSAFRIRVGEYRLGFFLENEQIILARFLSRKDIYKRFPK